MQPPIPGKRAEDSEQYPEETVRALKLLLNVQHSLPFLFKYGGSSVKDLSGEDADYAVVDASTGQIIEDKPGFSFSGESVPVSVGKLIDAMRESIQSNDIDPYNPGLARQVFQDYMETTFFPIHPEQDKQAVDKGLYKYLTSQMESLVEKGVVERKTQMIEHPVTREKVEIVMYEAKGINLRPLGSSLN